MIEKCADDGDLASQREAQNNEQALIRNQAAEAARIQATKAALENGNFDGLHCIDEECGEELPPQRLAEYRMLCTTCQSRKEVLAKQRGGR